MDAYGTERRKSRATHPAVKLRTPGTIRKCLLYSLGGTLPRQQCSTKYPNVSAKSPPRTGPVISPAIQVILITARAREYPPQGPNLPGSRSSMALIVSIRNLVSYHRCFWSIFTHQLSLQSQFHSEETIDSRSVLCKP